MAARVEVLNISKHFGDVQAINGMTLTVEKGEVHMLVGPSGCGKSTLLNLVAGLETPTSGTIKVGGVPVVGPGAERGFVFQDGGLFPWLNVQHNVEFGLKQAGIPTKERTEKSRAMLARMGLGGFESRYIHELSGGMRQRVAIARSLVLNPEVLLMDEPFSALDALTREDMYGLLQELWAQIPTTVLFVTHNVREAVTLGDRVTLLAPRPARIVATHEVTLERPREIDQAGVAKVAREISSELKHGPIPAETLQGIDI